MAELLSLQKEIQVLKREYVHAHRCEIALAGVYPRWNVFGVPQFGHSYHKNIYHISRANMLAPLFNGRAVHEQSLLPLRCCKTKSFYPLYFPQIAFSPNWNNVFITYVHLLNSFFNRTC